MTCDVLRGTLSLYATTTTATTTTNTTTISFQCISSVICVCWIRDGRESLVVTKVFDVERLESDTAGSLNDDLDFIREIPIAEVWMTSYYSSLTCRNYRILLRISRKIYPESWGLTCIRVWKFAVCCCHSGIDYIR